MAEAGKLAEIFDIDLEQACIGAMLCDPTHIPQALARCRPHDFFDPLHQRIVWEIEAQHEQGRLATVLTIHALLAFDPGLVEVGGKAYLVSLARSASPMPNVDDYGRLIAEFAQARTAAGALNEATESLHKGRGQNVSDALQELISIADNALAEKYAGDHTKPIDQAADQLLRELEEGQQSPQGMYAPTGIAALDEVIGGLYPKTLTVIGGRPGMGKSILGTTICRAAAAQGWAPHMFSLEMSGREVSARLIADLALNPALERGVEPLMYSKLLHHKKIVESGRELALDAARELRNLAIEVNDRDRLTFAQIAGLARARASKETLRPVVVVDHLHIIDPGERYGGRRVDEITEITKSAKQLAKRLDVPVVLLAQLNRGVENRDDKVPIMADFRDSGSVEQDADVILGVYRPAYYAAQQIRAAKNPDQRRELTAAADLKANLLQIEVLKNRNGPTKPVECWIDVTAAAIRDANPDPKGKGLLL